MTGDLNSYATKTKILAYKKLNDYLITILKKSRSQIKK